MPLPKRARKGSHWAPADERYAFLSIALCCSSPVGCRGHSPSGSPRRVCDRQVCNSQLSPWCHKPVFSPALQTSNVPGRLNVCRLRQDGQVVCRDMAPKCLHQVVGRRPLRGEASASERVVRAFRWDDGVALGGGSIGRPCRQAQSDASQSSERSVAMFMDRENWVY
jgi:hypothetical protein